MLTVKCSGLLFPFHHEHCRQILDSCWDVILRHLGVKNSKDKAKVRVWRGTGEEEETGVLFIFQFLLT